MEAHDEAQRLKDLGQDLFPRHRFAESAHRNAEGEMVNNLGVVYLRLDELEKADAYLSEARSIFEETGNRSGLGIVLCHQGMLRAAQDRPEHAVRLFEASIELLEEMGEPDQAKLVRREMRKVTGEGFPMSVARGLMRLLGRVTGTSAGDEEAQEAPEAEEGS
ncbi:MAG: hypothetical protein AMJ93_15860 [Anaerolineae bacterium SM23_84]|nr:MAG: hypothetical protein AMJ93_15860 [Anaerolineae bacterium SM23_84]